MNILIVGCGKVGIRLAEFFCRKGHEVSIVAKEKSQLSDLPENFTGLSVSGVLMDTDILEKAGIKECDAVVVVDDEDNLNIVIAQIAKDVYNIEDVIAVVYDSAREHIFESLGLKTVCPTNSTVAVLKNLVMRDSTNKMLNFGNTTTTFTTRFDSRYVGKRLCDIPLYKDEIIYGYYTADGKFSLAVDLERVVKENEKVVMSSEVD
ncbi:MAG: NAD-binding protein [bacterium]|nr:NAD-binding protein [bacterium]